MNNINPIDAFLWTLRRNEKDVVRLYNALSPIMQLATGSNMLNFGYWDTDVQTPFEAQSKLCNLIGMTAELESARMLVDVGSGFAAPALLWESVFKCSNIFCININHQQLMVAFKSVFDVFENFESMPIPKEKINISFINSTAIALPFANNSVDRVISLESAQHFKPFDKFIEESWRILSHKGLLVIALPVLVPLVRSIKKLIELGILALTWSSEHYRLDYVKSTIKKRFDILGMKMIGSHVYEPLSKYYIENRNLLRERILAQYPSYVENILYSSISQMRNVYSRGLIEYVVIKARKI